MALQTKSLKELRLLADLHPDGHITRKDITGYIDRGLLSGTPQWLTNPKKYRAGRGEYRLPLDELEGVSVSTTPIRKPAVVVESIKNVESPASNTAPIDAEPAKTELRIQNASVGSDVSFVPDVNQDYVRWGNSTDIKAILESGSFLPVFVTGLSGNGKTFMIEQEVAKLGRELFRVNITSMTDDDELLGGFRLIDGDTVWFDGPVIEAMKRGAVLLLDELDLGTEKIMSLQSVLEGKGVFVKKIGKWIKPAPGFMVIATGNTKGQGDDTDKFIGTNILNEAFLERFPVWLEQSYPTPSIEKRIVAKIFKHHNIEDDAMVENLVTFAKQTRDAYDNGAAEDLMTTRRLCLVANLVPVFGSVEKALEIACNRFTTETAKSFTTMFSKICEPKEEPTTLENTTHDDSVPF